MEDKKGGWLYTAQWCTEKRVSLYVPHLHRTDYIFRNTFNLHCSSGFVFHIELKQSMQFSATPPCLNYFRINSCPTCSVDTGRGHGAVEGRNGRSFFSLQLRDCFLFDWGWWHCFREGGREHVLAFLDTPEQTQKGQCKKYKSMQTKLFFFCVRKDIVTLEFCIMGDFKWMVGALKIQTQGLHRRL